MDIFSEGPGCGRLGDEPGYFYIYLSNDGTEGGEAFFDDFTILTLESYIVQQTDYYPYGLIARNFVRAGEKETKELFQGKTYEELTGWYDFHARRYDAALGRWFGVDAYTNSMPGVSPFNAMANNPVMFVDPDGNDPISLLVLGTAAVIGGGLNLWSNADKVKDFKSGLAYFASGAGGGMLSLVNPWAGGAFTSSANIGIDIATGNLPDFNNPWEVGKYAGYKVLDGISAGQAGNMSRGLISFAESGRFAWNTTFFGNSAKFTPTSKELHWAVGGLDIGEVAIVSNRVRLSNLAAPTLKQAASLVDDAAKGGLQYSDDLLKAAQQAYPKLADKTHLHHPFPKYMGGAEKQILTPLNAAYHQQITNEFLIYWPRKLPGQIKTYPTFQQAQEIMQKVYSKFPLPPG